MQQAIEQRGSHGWISGQFSPLGENSIGGQIPSSFLVARIDQMGEQALTAIEDRPIADFHR